MSRSAAREPEVGEVEPGDWGPRRVRQDEIRAVFTGNWRVESIEATGIDLNGDRGTAHSWLATIARD